MKELTVVYTPAPNLKKTKGMEIGAVGYKNDKAVKKIHVETNKPMVK